MTGTGSDRPAPAGAPGGLGPWGWFGWFGLAPFVALSFYAAPQLDDYCFAAEQARRGLAGAVAYYYAEGFTGRIVTNFLIMLPAAIGDAPGTGWIAAYRAGSVMLLLALAALALWASSVLWPERSRRDRVAAASLMLLALVVSVRSQRDLLYWLNAAFTYTVPGILLAVPLVRLCADLKAARATSPAAALTLVLCGATAALCNEFSGGTLCIIAIGSLIGRRLTPGMKMQPGLHAALALAGALGTAILAAAPGTAARMAEYPLSGDVAYAMSRGLAMTAAFIVPGRLMSPVFLAWLILVLSPPPSPVKVPVAAAALWVPVGISVAATYFAVAAGYFGQGHLIPVRAQNELAMIAFFALTIAALGLRETIGEAIDAWLGRRIGWFDWRRAGMLALAVILLAPPTLRAAYQAVVEAPAFSAGKAARFALLSASPEKAPVLAPLPAHPSLLLVEDIAADPGYFPNVCLARLFGKERITLAAPLP